MTVVELLEDMLLLLDADVRRAVRTHMEKRLGVRFLVGAGVEEVRADDRSVRARAAGETVEADCCWRPSGDGR